MKFSTKTTELAKKITKEALSELYYSTASKNVCIALDISYPELVSLLKFYKIKQKTRKEAENLKNTIDFHKKPALADVISKEELEKFYVDEYHSIRETCEQFNVTEGKLTTLLKYYKITKTKENIAKSKRDSSIRRNLKLYGVVNGGGSKQAQEKIKATMIEHFNGKHYFQTDEFKEKANKTKIAKYGHANVGQFGSEEHTKAMLTKYGVQTPMESDKIKTKLNENMIAKYGVNRYAKTLDFHKKARKLYKYNNISFDSSWELALYIYAVDHNEEIIRCPTQFIYYYNNKKHIYVPDFLYKNQLIEIKGDNWFDESGKMICAVDNTKNNLFYAKYLCGINNNVVFWKKDDIKFALNYCIIKYNNKKWYKQFIRKVETNG